MEITEQVIRSAGLSSADANYLVDRFGFTREPLSLTEAARDRGISRVTMRAVEISLLKRVRDFLAR